MFEFSVHRNRYLQMSLILMMTFDAIIAVQRFYSSQHIIEPFIGIYTKIKVKSQIHHHLLKADIYYMPHSISFLWVQMASCLFFCSFVRNSFNLMLLFFFMARFSSIVVVCYCSCRYCCCCWWWRWR